MTDCERGVIMIYQYHEIQLRGALGLEFTNDRYRSRVGGTRNKQVYYAFPVSHSPPTFPSPFQF